MRVSPGPCSAAGHKSALRLIGLFHPILDVHDSAENPELTDLFMATSAEGDSGAEVALCMQQVILTAVMEFLFPRPDHGGMRFVDTANLCFCPQFTRAALNRRCFAFGVHIARLYPFRHSHHFYQAPHHRHQHRRCAVGGTSAARGRGRLAQAFALGSGKRLDSLLGARASKKPAAPQTVADGEEKRYVFRVFCRARLGLRALCSGLPCRVLLVQHRHPSGQGQRDGVLVSWVYMNLLCSHTTTVLLLMNKDNIIFLACDHECGGL